jgi:hypothetical protein
MVQAKSRLRTKTRKAGVDGPKPIVPNSEAVAKAALALVARVNVVAAAEAPGVTLTGENVAVHLPGRPVQLKVTGESNVPYCGVNWIA